MQGWGLVRVNRMEKGYRDIRDEWLMNRFNGAE